MNSLSVLLMPMALLYPSLAGHGANAPVMPQGLEAGLAADAEQRAPPPLGLDPVQESRALPLNEAPMSRPSGQVRIEQRIIMRISPRRPGGREELQAQLPRSRTGTKVVERKIGSCLNAKNIDAVQTGPDNRLLLFMHDRRVISAELEKSCNARDFYSGFYVERSKDGKICVQRDRIHSRAGAKCSLRQLSQLVAVSD